MFSKSDLEREIGFDLTQHIDNTIRSKNFAAILGTYIALRGVYETEEVNAICISAIQDTPFSKTILDRINTVDCPDYMTSLLDHISSCLNRHDRSLCISSDEVVDFSRAYMRVITLTDKLDVVIPYSIEDMKNTSYGEKVYHSIKYHLLYHDDPSKTDMVRFTSLFDNLFASNFNALREQCFLYRVSNQPYKSTEIIVDIPLELLKGDTKVLTPIQACWVIYVMSKSGDDKPFTYSGMINTFDSLYQNNKTLFLNEPSLVLDVLHHVTGSFFSYDKESDLVVSNVHQTHTIQDILELLPQGHKEIPLEAIPFVNEIEASDDTKEIDRGDETIYVSLQTLETLKVISQETGQDIEDILEEAVIQYVNSMKYVPQTEKETFPVPNAYQPLTHTQHPTVEDKATEDTPLGELLQTLLNQYANKTKNVNIDLSSQRITLDY